MKIEVGDTVTLDGEQYITVQQMSSIINKSNQTIYHLINKGNSIRKMRAKKISGITLIPYKEVVEFPFTWAGKLASQNIYHYDYDGNVIEYCCDCKLTIRECNCVKSKDIEECFERR